MCPGLGQGSGTLGWLLLGGVSWEGDNALLYPVTRLLGEQGWEHRAGIAQASL